MLQIPFHFQRRFKAVGFQPRRRRMLGAPLPDRRDAVAVFHINDDPRVRIHPIEFLGYVFDRDWLIRIILGGE